MDPRKLNDANSQKDQEDHAMDSMLRELGRATNNDMAFLGRVQDRIETGLPTEKAPEAHKETFFGFAPLAEAIDFDPSPSEVSQKETEKLPVHFGVGSWLAVAGVTLFAIAAGLFGYLSSTNSSNSPVTLNSNEAHTTVIDALPKSVDPTSSIAVTDSLATSFEPELEIAGRDETDLNETLNQNSPIQGEDSNFGKRNPIVDNRIELPVGIASESYSWHLKVRFDNDGNSRTFLNGNPILPQITLDKADKAINDIGYQVVRRFCFLSPTFETPLRGAIEIAADGETSKVYQFGSLEQLNEAFHQTSLYLRQTTHGAAPNVDSMSRSADYTDEVTSQTEEILHELIASSFSLDEMMFVVLQHKRLGQFKYYRTIDIDQLEEYVSSGELKLPDPEETFLNQATFNSRQLASLQQQLQYVAPVSLFNDTEDFLEVEKRILAASPRGKVLADVNKLNADLARLTKSLNQAEGDQQFGTPVDSGESPQEIRKQIKALSPQVQNARNRLARTPLDPAVHNLSLAEQMKIQMISAEIGKELTKLFRLRKNESDFEKIQNLDEQGLVLSSRLVKERREIIRSSSNYAPSEPLEPMVSLLANRTDLQGLDFVMGDACHLEEHDAETMGDVSQMAGRVLGLFDPFGSRDFSNHGQRRLNAVKRVIDQVANGENPEQGLTTLDQMLQMERPELRLELVKALRINQSSTAAGLLACYAKYDLAPSVRAAATDALRSFPPASYRTKLLDGFAYPWAEVAKHSAEALVRLNDQQSVTQLVSLLKAPDPRAPRESLKGDYSQREMVAINHMKNCALCHADSQDTQDFGRGRIPTWEKRLPQQYYREESGAMVRADVTYLRQDFSVVQKVENAAPWPTNQRFDYVVRNKQLSKEEFLAEKEKYSDHENEYHSAIDMVLRMLTGHDPKDSSYATWQALVSN